VGDEWRELASETVAYDTEDLQIGLVFNIYNDFTTLLDSFDVTLE